MSNICIITGKTTKSGYTVSHSNHHTKRKIYPNIQTRRLKNPATGRLMKVTVSARGLRTLKKWDREGKKYDLVALQKSAN